MQVAGVWREIITIHLGLDPGPWNDIITICQDRGLMKDITVCRDRGLSNDIITNSQDQVQGATHRDC
jgi:hypothetical protein